MLSPLQTRPLLALLHFAPVRMSGFCSKKGHTLRSCLLLEEAAAVLQVLLLLLLVLLLLLQQMQPSSSRHSRQLAVLIMFYF